MEESTAFHAASIAHAFSGAYTGWGISELMSDSIGFNFHDNTTLSEVKDQMIQNDWQSK